MMMRMSVFGEIGISTKSGCVFGIIGVSIVR